MSYAYDNSRSSRNNFREPQGLTGQATLATTWALVSLKGLWTRQKNTTGGGNVPRKSLMRRLLSLGNILILLWIYVIYWGERTVFDRAIDECDWRNWENWVCLSSFLVQKSVRCSGAILIQLAGSRCTTSPCCLRRRPSTR